MKGRVDHDEIRRTRGTLNKFIHELIKGGQNRSSEMNTVLAIVSNTPVTRWLSRAGKGALFALILFLWIGSDDTQARRHNSARRAMKYTTVRGYLP